MLIKRHNKNNWVSVWVKHVKWLPLSGSSLCSINNSSNNDFPYSLVMHQVLNWDFLPHTTLKALAQNGKGLVFVSLCALF
jgi:hypothetical protein